MTYGKGKRVSAIGYYNGTIGPIDSMLVPMNDRAVYFGDGCYEACYAINGKLFRGEAHIDRFYRSLAGLRIAFSHSAESLKKEIERCLDAAGEPNAAVYWQVSRGTDTRHHTFPDASVQPNLLITVSAKVPDLNGTPLRLLTVPDIRYQMCNVKTLNLVPNILAIQQAREAGADEAALHRDGVVTEGSHTNLSILKDGVLYTHPRNRQILSGVTRGVLLELCGALRIPVSETPFTVDEMKRADEVLITSSLLGIRRASQVDGEPVGNRADALYRALIRAYRERFIGEIRA